MKDLKYSEILALNNALSHKSKKGMSLRVAILGNITINPLKEILQYALRLRNIESEIMVGDYDNIVQDAQKYKEFDVVIIFYDVFGICGGQPLLYETFLPEKIEQIEQRVYQNIDLLFSFLNKTKTVIFNSFSAFSIFTIPYHLTKIEQTVAKINTYLWKNHAGNISIINIDSIISLIGKNTAFDMRMYRSSKAPYSLQFLKNYALAAESIIANQNGRIKKALIFDCDNTLWSGILSEDGSGNINMSAEDPVGAVYNCVQQLALHLSKWGVIIGLCSKNNREDVISLFETNPDMVLKMDHIIIDRINWQDKVTNLCEIAKELNIGLDSLIFVDDSDFEINHVCTSLPEVVTLQVPKNIYDYPEQLLKTIYHYFPLQNTNEDSNKIQEYKNQQKREKIKEKFNSVEDYLSSLHIEISVDINNSESIERIVQLTQKTNQFNLTTKRYTAIQIQEFINDQNVDVFSFKVKDDFGDSGLTALVITKRDQSIAQIDSFLLSCRIIGRYIENSIMDYVMEYVDDKKCTIVNSSFFQTGKNAQVSDLYEKFGFTVEAYHGLDKEYRMETKNYQNQGKPYIKLNPLVTKRR